VSLTERADLTDREDDDLLAEQVVVLDYTSKIKKTTTKFLKAKFLLSFSSPIFFLNVFPVQPNNSYFIFPSF